MQAENQVIDIPANVFQEKAAPVMNSQGELVEAQQPQQQAEPQQAEVEEDFFELGDTPLSQQMDALMPSTDDTGMEHRIISCGHVLKSTHDLARWSEKTGARRVNTEESIDSISDLAINLEPNRTVGARNSRRAPNTNTNNNGQQADPTDGIQGLFNEGGKRNGGGRRNGNNRNSWRQQQQSQTWQPVEGAGSGEKSEVIQCWPVLKSTHDQAQLSEKRGRNAVNQAGSSETLEELALNSIQQTQQQGQQQSGSDQIINSWPVLKSTHDLAQLSEKRGPDAVNQSSGICALEEVIKDQDTQGAQGFQGLQAGGNSLQSGLDTQAGSHVQMDNQQ